MSRYNLRKTGRSDYYWDGREKDYRWNGYGWKGVNGNWDWSDKFYRIYFVGDGGAYIVSVWNSDEITEYMKLQPPDTYEESLCGWGEDHNVWLRRVEKEKNEWIRHRQERTEFFSVERECDLVVEEKDFSVWMMGHRNDVDFIKREKMNKDKYDKLKVKLNKAIKKKKRGWDKSIKINDVYEYASQQTYTFGDRIGNFIWVKTTFIPNSTEYDIPDVSHRKYYGEWKIYKIYEHLIEFKSHQNYRTRKCMRLKNIQEYIVPIRDTNTHHRYLKEIANLPVGEYGFPRVVPYGLYMIS